MTAESFSTPIDWFLPENRKLKALSKEDQNHIERHIPNASYSEFLLSLERQKVLYKKTKEAYKTWKEKTDSGEKLPRPSTIFYPCLDCLYIAEKLNIK